MTKIAVLSDTHIRNGLLPKEILKYLKGKDYIIHAGDYMSCDIVKQLEKYSGFIGVAGNNDSYFIKKELGEKKIVTIENVKIGICHGYGFGYNAFENAKRIFSLEKVDLVVFGHSHIPKIEDVEGKVFINPGSITCPRGGYERSFAEIQIDKHEVNHKIRYID